MRNKTVEDKKPGPEPDRLKLSDDWKKAVGKALQKRRPQPGWPKPEKEVTKKPKHK